MDRSPNNKSSSFASGTLGSKVSSPNARPLKKVIETRNLYITPRFKADANDLNPGEPYFNTEDYKEKKSRECPYVRHLDNGTRERFLMKMGLISTTVDRKFAKELAIQNKLQSLIESCDS